MTTEVDTLTIGVSADTRAFEASLRSLSRETDGFSRSISRAFAQAIAGGRSFESVLSSLALKLAGLALDRALAPVTSAISSTLDGLFKSFGLANGGVVSNGVVQRFADGGIVARPTVFPLARGLGLMGEAGPEAVLPLARGADGTLGVRSGGGQPISVVFNVTAADADSFRKSEAQVTAMLARAVARGRRGM